MRLESPRLSVASVRILEGLGFVGVSARPGPFGAVTGFELRPAEVAASR